MAEEGTREPEVTEPVTPSTAASAATVESPPTPERVRHGEDALPGWYRTAGAASWRFLVIIAAVGAVAYALVYLRVVVLPIIVALLVSTLLLPIVRWLKGRGVPD